MGIFQTTRTSVTLRIQIGFVKERLALRHRRLATHLRLQVVVMAMIQTILLIIQMILPTPLTSPTLLTPIRSRSHIQRQSRNQSLSQNRKHLRLQILRNPLRTPDTPDVPDPDEGDDPDPGDDFNCINPEFGADQPCGSNEKPGNDQRPPHNKLIGCGDTEVDCAENMGPDHKNGSEQYTFKMFNEDGTPNCSHPQVRCQEQVYEKQKHKEVIKISKLGCSGAYDCAEPTYVIQKCGEGSGDELPIFPDPEPKPNPWLVPGTNHDENPVEDHLCRKLGYCPGDQGDEETTEDKLCRQFGFCPDKNPWGLGR